MNLKNPISFKIADELPLETGLATIFETITGHKPNAKLPLNPLDKNIGEIEKPKPCARPVPILAVIQGMPKISTRSEQDEHEVVDFQAPPFVQALDDVDRDSLAEHPPIQEWSGVRDRMFVNSEQAIYYFQEFLRNVLGFEGIAMKQALAQCPGKQYIVKMRLRPFQNQQGEADIQFEVESRAHV